MLTIALSHLLGRGVRLETHEAVALARELLAHPCGIPTAENIQLGSDGSVSCISSDGMPSVANVADLLLTLLPAGTPNVPAPLRYAIARGLEAVEAPPFGSLSEFSKVLERFEKGASRDVLKGVLQRGARSSPPIVQPIAASPLMFRSYGSDADAPEHSLRWWVLVAAVALAASFALGFAVMDRIVDRRAAITSGVSPLVPGVSAAAVYSCRSASIGSRADARRAG
jgi:hypothetical protein